MATKKFITDENLKRFATNVKSAIKTAADEAKKNPAVKTINGVSILGSGDLTLSDIGIDGDIVRVVAALPELTDAAYNKLYLVPVSDAPDGNSYAEYVKVNNGTADKWEKLGEWKADVKIENATTTAAGLMSAADKTILDTINADYIKSTDASLTDSDVDKLWNEA